MITFMMHPCNDKNTRFRIADSDNSLTITAGETNDDCVLFMTTDQYLKLKSVIDNHLSKHYASLEGK